MDLSWVMIIIGAVLVFGYIFYNAMEQRMKALETRVRNVEKLLQKPSQGQKITEPEINEELRQLVRHGKRVEAVKRTRQEFGWSLLEAKQYVDGLKAQE